MIDPYGNLIQVFSRYNRLVVDMYLGGWSKMEDGSNVSLSFSPKFCRTLMQDVVKPLFSTLYYAYFINGVSSAMYGDKQCAANRKCIRNVSLAEINSYCNICTEKKVKFAV